MSISKSLLIDQKQIFTDFVKAAFPQRRRSANRQTLAFEGCLLGTSTMRFRRSGSTTGHPVAGNTSFAVRNVK